MTPKRTSPARRRTAAKRTTARRPRARRDEYITVIGPSTRPFNRRLTDEDFDRSYTTELTPEGFIVKLALESHLPPCIWIGTSNDPDHQMDTDDPKVQQWATIGPDDLRRLAERILHHLAYIEARR